MKDKDIVHEPIKESEPLLHILAEKCFQIGFTLRDFSKVGFSLCRRLFVRDVHCRQFMNQVRIRLQPEQSSDIMVKHTKRYIGINRRYLQTDCYTSRMFRIIIAHRRPYAAVNDCVKGIKKDRILYLPPQIGFGNVMQNMWIHL